MLFMGMLMLCAPQMPTKMLLVCIIKQSKTLAMYRVDIFIYRILSIATMGCVRMAGLHKIEFEWSRMISLD